MKNTKEAVRYGIETLKLTPEELFALIESSNGYSGDDYNRWLANEIIKIAEKDEVGYSQLLVKKFAIIQSLAEDSDAEIREEWLNKLKELAGEDCYSIDFDFFGVELVKDVDKSESNEDEISMPSTEDTTEASNEDIEIDWYSGIDYDSENSFFAKEELPKRVYEKLLNNEDLSIVARLSSESCGKNSDMFVSAKSYNIVCKNEGSLLLYRMCSIVDAFNSGKEFKFSFLVNADFLTNQDNADILKYFLNYFTCSGFTVKSTELFSDMYISTNYAFITCTPRINEEIQDGLELEELKLNSENETEVVDIRRYCRSSESMLSYLVNSSKDLDSDVQTEKDGVLTNELGRGLSNALGYLNVNNVTEIWLTCNPDTNAKTSIPITKNNLEDVIVYYAVSKSLSSFGMTSEITKVVTGNAEYPKLLYNCLPLFLFDVDTNFKDYMTEDGQALHSAFNILNSDLVKGLLAKGEILFSFEAKELVNICKGFIDYLNTTSDNEDSVDFKTFKEVREEANHPDLNSSYLSALINIKDYIKTLYRTIE